MKKSGGLPHLDLEKEGNSKHVAPSWHSSASRAAVGAMTEIKAGAARSLAAGVGAEKTPLFPLLRRSFYAAEHAGQGLII